MVYTGFAIPIIAISYLFGWFMLLDLVNIDIDHEKLNYIGFLTIAVFYSFERSVFRTGVIMAGIIVIIEHQLFTWSTIDFTGKIGYLILDYILIKILK